MPGQQELQVQQKREVEKAQEATRPMRAFLPNTDIFETEDALTLVLEMPGVDRENIDLNVENGVLTVEGRIDSRIPVLRIAQGHLRWRAGWADMEATTLPQARL
jgi:HSP20 family molecular chaperone IbpA